MADPANRLERKQPAEDSSTVEEFPAPPGVSPSDAAFLAELWTELRNAEHPRFPGDQETPLDPSEIQTLIEASLRATPEVAAYKHSLERLASAHPEIARDAEGHARQLGYFANTVDHFLHLNYSSKLLIQWRVYIAPAPASAPDLLASLYGRLQSLDVLANVGMKVSAYDGLRRCRDGLVIYANDASLKAVLTAVRDEAAANPGRFTRDIVRFTRPIFDVAGLARAPEVHADKWRPQVEAWAKSNQDWVKGRTVAWNADVPPQHMSYTQLLGSVLTSCYALALAQSPPSTVMRSRSGQVSAFQARPLYVRNVGEAFKDLGINPSDASLGAPSVSGAGWLRYRFF